MSQKRYEILLFIGVWTAWTLLASGLIAHQERIPYAFGLYTNVIFFGLAALLSIGLIRLAGFFERRIRGPVLRTAAITITCVAYSIAWIQLSHLVFRVMFGRYFVNLFDPRAEFLYPTGVIIAGLVFGVVYARRYARRLHEAELNRAELHYLAKESELRALRSQLNPHFLFNAMNSVYAMIDSDPERARNMLVKISDLLRVSLSEMDREMVSFEEDLAFAKKYLEIEKIRHGDKLLLESEVTPAALDASVPSLLLQPLVENAVKHGVSHTPHPVTITITARRNGGHMNVSVRDTGAGTGSGNSSGHGLRNLRERLQRLYGDDHGLAVRDDDQGFEVAVRIPVRAKEAS